MLKKKKIYFLFKKFLFLVLPLILLFIIFNEADLKNLIAHLKKVDLLYFFIGLIIMPFSIILGSKRWQILNNFFCKSTLPFKLYSYHYWTGLAIGYFTPGNLGWDAYRIISIAKRLKNYSASIITVVSEKFIGLFSMFLLILILFPVIERKIIKKEDLFEEIYLMLFTFFIIFLLGMWYLFHWNGKNFLKRRKIFIGKFIFKFARFLKLEKQFNNYTATPVSSDIIYRIKKAPHLLFFSLLLSMGILFFSALSNHFYFLALGYEIDFLVNMFAAPIFFILFFVPLSFGSLGVREGVYILFYDYFGVPLEIALLVSLLSLIGVLLNNAIGVVTIFGSGIQGLKK